VLPKHYYSRFEPAQINRATGLLLGSGPYKLEVLDPDRQWTQPAPCELVRNERYWGVKPAIAKMRYKAIDNEQARLVSYRNGEGDMVTPSAPQFKKLTQEPEWDKNNRSLNWVNMKSGNSFIAWQCGPRGTTGKPTPFADKRVRRAMTMMLDREKMIQTIWAGVGAVSKGVNNPASPASDPEQKPLPYDVEGAKRLLAEAGWKDRDGNGVVEDEKGNEFVFEFTYSSGGEIAERIATFMKDSCARVGIRCQPKGVDWAVIDSITKSRDFDALTMAWGANSPESDPRQIWHSDSIQNQGDNFIQWSNPTADRLIDQGRKELDFDKRMVIWHKFERAVEEDQPYTWIRIQPYLRFVSTALGNVQTYPKSLEPREYFRFGGPPTPSAGN
jgi:peptide/nickel transport system substrate-binding protein